MSDRSVEDVMPLSLGQKALWFLHKFSNDHSAYNINLAWKIHSPLNLSVLEESLQLITERHSSLHTCFENTIDGDLCQKKNNKPKVTIEVVDVSNWDQNRLNEELQTQSHRPFNLSQDILWRWVVYQEADSCYTVFCSVHHIAVDLWSLMILMQELSLSYTEFHTALTEGQDSKIATERLAKMLPPVDDSQSYKSFVERQEKLLNSSKGVKLKAYWHKQLKGATEPLNLPLDRSRPPIINYRGGRRSLPLNQALVKKIELLTEREGVSLYSFFLSAYQLLLHRYSGQTNILIASPTAGRRPKENSAIGYYVNQIVIKTEINNGIKAKELIHKTHHSVCTGVLHQEYPFIKIVKDLQPKRDASRAPITSVSFAWNEPEAFGQGVGPHIGMNPDGCETWSIADMQWRRIDLRAQVDDFDLFLTTSKIDKNMAICLEYNSDLFEESTIDRMLSHYQELLTSITENPENPVCQLNFLTSKEKHQLKNWNDEVPEIKGQSKCVHEWIQLQAEAQPEAVAVICGEKEITYNRLNKKANQLARYLQNKGVTTNTLVGLCINRSIDMIIAMLGIQKAGGAYVPLDPNYPKDRLNFILEDAQISTVVTLNELKALLPDSLEKVVCLDIEANVIDAEVDANPRKGTPQQLAYVIFTSGSTGKPKGVAVTHQGVSALIEFTQQHFDSSELEGVLASTSLNFDIHVFETSVTLGLGGCSIVAENALYLPTIEARDKVKLINTVPSAIKALLQIDAIPKSVKCINLAGEPLTNSVVQAIYRNDNVKKVFNLYGPSEDTVYSTYYLTKKGCEHEPYIGKPINGTQAYVLDKHMQKVPVGLEGELYLGGDGLAREYINRPDITKDRFISNPFDNDADSRLFRTGDLVKLRQDGEIELIGRADFQVKIRGFRIELGEIETNLYRHKNVNEAIVVAHEDLNGEQALAAYIVPETPFLKEKEYQSDLSQDALEQELKEFLKKTLPEYMVPSKIIALQAMPLNPNGKIDRKALPKPRFEDSDRRSERRAPRRSKLATQIASAWSKVLGVKDIPIHANFFDLGGHSLLMVQVYANLREHLPDTVGLIELYQYPSIHTLESFIRKLGEGDKGQTKVQRKRKRAETRIAVVGMACRFPGANNPAEFWDVIREGKETIKDFTLEEIEQSGVDSETAQQSDYVMRSGALDRVEEFDAGFFGFTPIEAQVTDPQQRIFLECAWEALEDAGINPGSEGAGIIGIFGGSGQNSYYLNHVSRNARLQKTVGSYQLLLSNDKDFLCSRVAYKFNTDGPTMAIQSACSTSLYAAHAACQSLMRGDCDVALAGGVSLASLNKGYLYQEGMILSPDGHCRSFDSDAQGTVPSQGSGILVLKRLNDAIEEHNHIYAQIIGSAVNNDGSDKVGYSAPAVSGQTKVIQAAHYSAGIDPSTISYIEAHGTATPFGDPVEIKALTEAFTPQNDSDPKPKESSCAIGSVKTNIGHTDSAAGVAGLIKAIASLNHQMIPPSLHYKQANPEIDFSKSPFYVNTQLKPWLVDAQRVRRAGVSSFGMGGTNAHIVVEEYRSPNRDLSAKPSWQLIPLSAKTESALEKMIGNLSNHITNAGNIELIDIAYTLQSGRKELPYRQYFLADSVTDLNSQLSNFEDYSPQSGHVKEAYKHNFAFMFSGQGSQYVGMGKSLYENVSYYKEQVDHCLAVLKSQHAPLFALYSEDELKGLTDNINDTFVTQPALFILEYSLAKLLMSWGLNPSYLIGHSLGEYVAACLADVMSLEDALFLLINRAELTRRIPSGGMLSVKLSEADVAPLLNDQLDLAVINSSERCSIAGPHDAIQALYEHCKANEIECRKLSVSHAFHSSMLDPILVEFRNIAKEITLNAPKIPVVSNVTGTWLTKAQAKDPDYWVTHLRHTNRFSDGVSTLLKDDSDLICLEVGPGRVLATLARQHHGKQSSHSVYSTLPHSKDDVPDQSVLLKTLGMLWCKGHPVDWRLIEQQEQPSLISLPTYPFERKRYWIEPLKTVSSDSSCAIESDLTEDNSPDTKQENSYSETEQQLLNMWKDYLGHDEIDIKDNFFDLGGDSLMAVRLVNNMRDLFKIELDNHVLMKKPTIKQLGKEIDGLIVEAGDGKADEKEKSSEILVELQKGELPGNWFLIHPGGGHLYFYNDLIRRLKSRRSIYGIQARGVDGLHEPISCIKTMAKVYIEEIEKVQPEGPYWIGGSSFGGMVAFEIAQQLKQNGREVPLLFMLDTPGPGQEMISFKSNAEIIQHFFEDLELSFEELEQKEDDLDEQVNYVIDVAKQKRKTDMLPPHFGSHFIRMVTAHYHAMFEYQPQEYDGNIVFFKHDEEMIEYASHPELAWLPLTKKSGYVLPIPGNHLTMNFDPGIQMVAKHLHRIIQDMGESP